MPDVEFLDETPYDAAPEPMLPGQRRWPWLVAALAAVAALVGFVLAQGGDRPTRPSAEQPLRTSAPHPTPTPVVGGDAPALAVAMVGPRTWVLHSRLLVASGGAGGAASVPVPGPELVSTDHDGPARLVLDLPARRVWVVFLGSGRVFGFDSDTLRRVLTTVLPGHLSGAAATHGDLFVVGSATVYDVAARGTYRTRVHDTAKLLSITAGAPGGRLIMTSGGYGTLLWSITPRTGPPLVRRGHWVPVGDGLATVVAGHAWLVGADLGKGTMFSVDARRLRAIGTPIYVTLTGVQLQASGAHVFWVRPRDHLRRLLCIDAATGDAVQAWWRAPGGLASAAHRALRTTDHGAVPLTLTTCPG